MERFAVINDKLRLNMYNICRLCGIDNPSKIKILDSLKIPSESDEEPCLSKKIECVVGIKVKRNDQMPQTICTLCADKINDFFEYREMCGATNRQTKKLLGIPLEVAKRKKPSSDKEVKLGGESILGLGIEDEDSKSSGKHSKAKARPKKKGNSSSSSSSHSNKKKVCFKDDEVKVENEEIKTESQSTKISNKSGSKRLKIDVKKIPDPAPLLTLKEPNKRERRREIDAQKLERRRIREEQKREIEEKKREIEVAKQILEQKKLEKKRKRKHSDREPAIKKLKHEPEVGHTSLHYCSICSETFTTSDLLLSHLQQSHTVSISTYGCSSCAESFKSLNEEKDHELWHTLSKTSYICPICNVAFDKTSIFTRHITLCKPFNLTPTVTNIHCDKCSQEFLTQNLYQWHKCFVKSNGTCWHCSRIFVKASTLFKHTFKCSSRHSTDSSHKEHRHSGDSKKNRKNRTNDRDSHIKSEPEANLDMDVSSSSHMLTSDMLPVVVLTKTDFKSNHPVAINAEDMSIKTENDFDFDDNTQMDEPFRDADDSDGDDEADQTVNGVGSVMDQPETFSDDDVILIENNDEPVLVSGSPSGTRNTVERPLVLPIVIKREPADNFEIISPPIFDPARKIKSEPLDENMALNYSVVKRCSPKRSSPKSRRNKKSTHKSHKERQHLVHIKKEPMDTDDLSHNTFRTSRRHNLGSAIVSLPTKNLLEKPIKQEPIRPGYDDFDPVLAMNIKKEPGLDDSSPLKPSLKLLISKNNGKLNAKILPDESNNADDVGETSPKASETKQVKDKCFYKKPALLAQKIKQEMVARKTKNKRKHASKQPIADDPNDVDFTVPVIARVLDATAIKIEPKSPFSSSFDTTESLLDMLTKDDVSDCSVDQFDAFNYDQFGGAINTAHNFPSNDNQGCSSSSTGAVFTSLQHSFLHTRESACGGIGHMEQNSLMSDSDDLKSLLDIDSLCSMHAIDSEETNELAQSANKISNCVTEPANDTKSTDHDNVTNDELMELAGITLNEFIKDNSNDESNGHLETDDFSNEVSNVLMANQQNRFDPMPFNETGHLSMDGNTFKIPDQRKVSFDVIDEIISTLPMSVDANVVQGISSLNSNDESTVVVNNASNPHDILSSKEKTDGKNAVFSDSRESNKLNYLNVNTHSNGESHLANSSICNESPHNATFKSTVQFLANGGDDEVENELLKSPIHDNVDYELNSVQTLTTSAIHEQLHSLLEDISEDSLSCDIDLDDKSVDWEWESKLLGD